MKSALTPKPLRSTQTFQHTSSSGERTRGDLGNFQFKKQNYLGYKIGEHVFMKSFGKSKYFKSKTINGKQGLA